MRIELLGAGDEAAVLAASHLFDGAAEETATRLFLSREGHHLLLAYEGDEAIGFVSGVETVHPDKGTEMFLYELGVDERARGRGVGRTLVEHLSRLARERGCYAMWVLTDADNDAALATYRHTGAERGSQHVMLTWDFPAD